MYYDKRIRYLSYYESGIKLQNAGYVKFQVRDSLCQMVVFMKGPRLIGSGEAKVYLLSEKQKKKEEDDFYSDNRKNNLQKHLLGNLGFRNGQGHCSVRLNAEDMAGSGLRYDEICGIRIELHEYQYLESRWVVMNFMPEKSGRRGMSRTSGQFWAEDAENAENAPVEIDLIVTPVSERSRCVANGPINEEQSVCEPEVFDEPAHIEGERQKAENETLSEIQEIAEKTPEKSEEKEDVEIRPDDREKSMQEMLEREVLKEESQKTQPVEAVCPVEAVQPEQTSEEEILRGMEDVWGIKTEEAQEEIKLPEQELHSDKWEQLKSTYPIVHPIREEEEYLKITPQDFVIFAEKYQELVHNSFLLHGYYNYKHLILGKKEKEGKTIYYLGVPGTFHEREKTVAVMFGFEAFDGKREPAQKGDFGYYLRRVEI